MYDLPEEVLSCLSEIYLPSNQRIQHQKSWCLKSIVDAYFSKKFSLKSKNSNEIWKLPPNHTIFQSKKWEDKYLIKAKFELNAVKSKLNCYDLKKWHLHTRSTNFAGDIMNIVRRKIHPEFLTQAWCKFYEIAFTYKLVPEGCSNHLNSIHLCEAPGAFITSLNHFLKLNHPFVLWNWLGTTLNPYYEGNELSYMVNDDRFIRHTEDNWWFGEDLTGDLFSLSNLKNLLDKKQEIGPIYLVTADGSIDCQNDPGEQEELVSPLHYCETVAALKVLSKGGNYVMKMFTMFECHTICLLYLLCCLFETVDLFKPATSKEGNSEVYCVCLNYSGEDDYFEEFLPYYGGKINKKTLFSKARIPEWFIARIRKCADFFKSLQVLVLERNVRTFEIGFEENEEEILIRLKKEMGYNFISKYQLTPLLNPCLSIVGNDVIGKMPKCMDPKFEEGTFSDRKALETCDFQRTLLDFNKRLNESKISWLWNDQIRWFDRDSFVSEKENLTMAFGMPFHRVNSSRFCAGNLLSMWNELFDKSNSLEPNNDFNKGVSVDIVKSIGMEDLFEGKIEVCDARKYNWNSDVSRSQMQLLDELYLLFKYILLLDSSFILAGAPLLTRFIVGLLHIIGSSFEKVGLCNPEQCGYAVIFFKMKEKRPLISIIEEIKKKCNEKKFVIHSLLPVEYLCDGELYSFITELNHIHLKTACQQMVSKLLMES